MPLGFRKQNRLGTRITGLASVTRGPARFLVSLHAPRSWHWKYLTLFFAACAMLADSAVAQDQRSPAKRIGVLMSGTAEGVAPYTGAFVQGMRELGWIEGKTAKFIMRFDNDDKSQLPKLAAELV